MNSTEQLLNNLISGTHDEVKNLGTFTSVYRNELVDKYLPYALNKNFVDKKAYTMLDEMEMHIDRFFKQVFKHSQGETIMTSGSTESILLTLYYAREKAMEAGNDKPNIIVSSNTHYSFFKCAKLLNVDVKVSELNEEKSMDLDDVEKLIDKNTVLVVGIMGATEHGVVDDLKALDQLCTKHNIDFHIDAAIGGFIIPFLKRKHNIPFKFTDFERLVSMNISGHKFGLALPGCGVLLLKDREYVEKYSDHLEYLSSGKNRIDSVLVTKSSVGVFSLGVNVMSLGFEGYSEIAETYLKTKDRLVEELQKFDLEFYVGSEFMPIVFIYSDDIHGVSNYLTKKGWVQGVYKAKALGFEGIRVVVKKNQEKLIERDFIQDLENYFVTNTETDFNLEKNYILNK